MKITPNYRIARSALSGKELVISVTRPVGFKKNNNIGTWLEKTTKMVDRNKLFEQNTNCRVFEHRRIMIRYYL